MVLCMSGVSCSWQGMEPRPLLPLVVPSLYVHRTFMPTCHGNKVHIRAYVYMCVAVVLIPSH